ncbi:MULTISPECIES: fumarylacetoacetate hydrolase family protein [Burkholderia]|nr:MULTISPECIES: fumarylacetoacetate hydrolase family protein [Burkholderia]
MTHALHATHFDMANARPIMGSGMASSASPAHLKLLLRGTERCIDIHRAFEIDRNFNVPPHKRTDDTVFRARDMRTIVSLERGMSCPAGVAVSCQIEIFAVIGEPAPSMPLSGSHPQVSAYGVAVHFVASLSERPSGASGSAPTIRQTGCSMPVAATTFECENNLLWLDVNNRPVLEATLGDMSWQIPELLTNCGRQRQMSPGDLVFTGATQPALLVKPGDVLRGGVEGLSRFCLCISSTATGQHVQIANVTTGTTMRSDRGC